MMSETTSRQSAPRGRGSMRGGRAGFGARGGRGGRGQTSNGDSTETELASSEEPQDITDMKKLHGSKVTTIKDMFPGWTDVDVVYALQETNGDLELTVEGIADGTITQWGEVSNTKKDRSRSKAVKDTVQPIVNDSPNSSRANRPARGTTDGVRGSRGRGSERGRSARGRGAPTVAHVNGTVHSAEPIPAEDAWTNIAKDEGNEEKSAETWGETAANAASTATAAVASVTSSLIPEGAKKSWASMFKAPAPAKKQEVPEKLPEPIHSEPDAQAEPHPEPEPEPAAAEPEVPEPIEESAPTPPATIPDADIHIAPSHDELTEDNVDQIPDTSVPAPTETAASTAASSWDPRNTSGNFSAIGQAVPRPQPSAQPSSGFAASAQKAAGVVGAGRMPSYQRRILDQEEAVRMPGNRDLDRAAVQFGAFNLGEDDVDGDREEAETRAQPPQHSPIAHPRASLPPAHSQDPGFATGLPSPKDAPTQLPAPHAAPGLPSPLPGAQGVQQQGSQSAYGRYGSYGQSGAQPEVGFGGKPYDPFSQQAPSAQNQFEGYAGQGHAPAQQPTSAQSQSATPSDYSQYYTAEQRNAYSNYYGQGYGQQSGQSQDARNSLRDSGYIAPSNDALSQYPQSSAAQAASRYSAAPEPQGSGPNTPAPGAQGQSLPGQTNQSAHQQVGPNSYQYGHPYQNSQYYSNYMSQHFNQGYGQGGYGGAGYGKGGMYSQHGYGQSPYDYNASPAASGFGQSAAGRDGAVGGGLNEYARGTPHTASQAANGGFGGAHDSFGRNSSYQSQQYGQHSGEDLKPFGESKPANGPSPLLAQAARPGSAANTAGTSALPTPASQQNYYGSHSQHGLGNQGQNQSPYGSLGAAGAHSGSQHNNQYAQYGQGFGGTSNYGGYGSQQQQQGRGGWGNNYGH